MPLVRVSSWPPNSHCARIIVKHDLRRSSHTLQALGILFCMGSVWILRARIDPFKPIIPLLNPRYSRGFIYRRNSDFIFVSLHLAKILSLRSKSISIVLPSFHHETVSSFKVKHCSLPVVLFRRYRYNVFRVILCATQNGILRQIFSCFERKSFICEIRNTRIIVRVLREIARAPYLVGRIPPCEPMLIGARVEAQKRKSVSWNGSVGAHVME